jgi:hypothetical protein
MLNKSSRKTGMSPAMYRQPRKALPDPSLVMLQSYGENIVMREERLQTYLEATHGVIGTFMRRGQYPERRFPTVAEIANKYEINEDDAKAMLKDVYSTHMKTEAKDEQAKTEMFGTVTQTVSDETVTQTVIPFVEYLLLLRGSCAGLRPPTICAKSSKAYNENTLRQD